MLDVVYGSSLPHPPIPLTILTSVAIPPQDPSSLSLPRFGLIEILYAHAITTYLQIKKQPLKERRLYVATLYFYYKGYNRFMCHIRYIRCSFFA